MKIRIAKVAFQEFLDAKYYYELQQPGLGQLFQQHIREALSRIGEYPEAWPVERNDIRRCVVHKFPYKILYSIQSDTMLVLAFANQHRNPDYWINRTQG